MIPSLKSEFRKILTVRMTYYILAGCILLLGIAALIVGGYMTSPEAALNPFKLSNEIMGASGAISTIVALIGLLLVANEYRYGTIMYTLTESNSRTKSFFAKVIAASVFAVVAAIVFGLLAVAFTYIGLAIKGVELVPQTLYFKDIIFRGLFSSWAYMMYAVIFAALIRNQIGAIIAFFIVPSTVEGLLTLLLKDNTKYLPFTALGRIAGPSFSMSMVLIVCGYVAAGLILAWFFFVRRDAN